MHWLNYDTFQKANNKGADQTARMPRVVCVFVVRKPPKTGFSHVEAHLVLVTTRKLSLGRLARILKFCMYDRGQKFHSSACNYE